MRATPGSPESRRPVVNHPKESNAVWAAAPPTTVDKDLALRSYSKGQTK
jgi:hypothetical protein